MAAERLSVDEQLERELQDAWSAYMAEDMDGERMAILYVNWRRLADRRHELTRSVQIPALSSRESGVLREQPERFPVRQPATFPAGEENRLAGSAAESSRVLFTRNENAPEVVLRGV